MSNTYQNPQTLKNYLAYLNSDDAKTEQQLIYEALLLRLPGNPETGVLDAACGCGWLAGKLAGKFKKICGFDSSAALIAKAKTDFPVLDFAVADAAQPLPYGEHSFDCVILNMAAHDIGNLPAALMNLHRILKPGGQLLMAVANPYYAYPVGVWKRGLFRFLLRMVPVLKLRPYNKFTRAAARAFAWKKTIPSYFYTLPEYFNTALKAGFSLSGFEEITSTKDNSKFNRLHQLYRFPLILLLEFKKPAE